MREVARRLARRPGADPEGDLLTALRSHPTIIVNEVEAFCDTLTEPITARLVAVVAKDLLDKAQLAVKRAMLLGL
jgi:hypothetical protein